jgi:hypothetical protein
MRAGKSLSRSTDIAELVEATGRTADEAAWRDAFQRGFDRLRPSLHLHPQEQTASATFEAAAQITRAVASECLPLGIAIVMHLYPLCTLRCVPLPWWSAAHRRRARFLRAVDSGSLILANAGSERGPGTQDAVSVTRTRGGVRVAGTYDYVSLAHVADVVLFSAPYEGHAIFCAADVRDASVRIGDCRFKNSMRLSDTCSVTFDEHFVPAGRCIDIPTASALQCMAQYQRSWFQLLLAESYLGRIELLQRTYRLPCTIEQIASFNELARLREYALRLLDESDRPRTVMLLGRVAEALKLRVSLLAQAISAAVREFDATAAAELQYIKRQPTSDDRIVENIAANLRQIQGCKKDGSTSSFATSRARALSDTTGTRIAV